MSQTTMTRSLRPRKERKNYAAIVDIDDENDDDASVPAVEVLEVDASSGSDFEMADAENENEDHDNNENLSAGEGSMDIEHLDEASNEEYPQQSKGKGKATSRRPTKTLPKTSTAPGRLRPAVRQNFSLPNPSVHHRHRPMPLFSRLEKVEQLVDEPKMFHPPNIRNVNSFTSSKATRDRLSKAWGFNVGSGPLWDLIEDRGWYKEAYRGGTGSPPEPEKEASRRPHVYQNVRIKDGWKILDKEKASKYLPKSDDNPSDPPRPTICAFGPYGKQTKVEMNIFNTQHISQFFPGKRSIVFNAGAPVWGLDWCPIHPDDRPGHEHGYYLAVAPLPSKSYVSKIGSQVSRPFPSCIQIWSLKPGPGDSPTPESRVNCEMVLCLEGGPAHEIRWCPLPAGAVSDGSSSSPRTLGILAGTFVDGSLSIYAVPDPRDLISSLTSRERSEEPVYVHIPEPLLRIQLEDTACWSLDWANSEIIAVGCTNGSIAVYDISHAISNGEGPNIYPIHYISPHQSAVRALCWLRVPPSGPAGELLTGDNPTIIASGGYDGVECMIDIREPGWGGGVINRTRDIIPTMAYAPYEGGPITIDHENIIKVFSASPAMLGRGHILLEPGGPVWGIATSDYHPQIAVGSANGVCQTTNSMKLTRRGGSVAFFTHKIFQMDYNRNTKEFRMLENFLPQEIADLSPAVRGNRSTEYSTGIWPPEIAVHRVAWHSGSGLGGSPLLASGTASGLVRIDWLLGRWFKDKVPYAGVDNIRRGEVEEDEDANSNESEDELDND